VVVCLLVIAWPLPLSAETHRWTIVEGKSRAGFEAAYRWGSVAGASESPSGEVELDVDDLKQPVKGALTIRASTLHTWKAAWDKDVWGVLDAEHHPEISYRIEKIESSFPSLTENADVTLTIHGLLSIRGVERPASFMSRLRLRQGTLWVRGESYLKASDFAIPSLRYLLLFPTKDRVLATFDLILNKAP
jgi:polyisoprenoid-binding protein YceI